MPLKVFSCQLLSVLDPQFEGICYLLHSGMVYTRDKEIKYR